MRGSKSHARNFQRPRVEFLAGHTRFCLGQETKIMGVLNVTPDSFSDGGRYSDPAKAEERALAMQDEGAHILDIGAESTRPGSTPIGWRVEWGRLKPVIKRLHSKIQIPLSIDTYKPEVAHAAMDEGVALINDITGLRSKKMARLVSTFRASIVLMHMQGDPRTMQKRPLYRDVVRDVKKALKTSVSTALDAGISMDRIMIDPGFGFGKTPEHNFLLLSHLDQLATLGYPVLVGLSRKSFLGHLTGLPAAERLNVSVAAAVSSIERGAHFLRVHDVAAHRQCATIVDRVLNTDR